MLRRFGADVWQHGKAFVEHNFDAADSQALLREADLAHGDEAIFFARYVFLIMGDTAESAEPLHLLLGHPNWRVRAALAEALRDQHAPATDASQLVMDTLVHDDDYKVRAAAALAADRVAPEIAINAIRRLVSDDNWHVRDRVLRGLLSRQARAETSDMVVTTALSLISADPSWTTCPVPVRSTLYRLRLLHNPGNVEHPDTSNDVDALDRALFGVLRELHTNWLPVPRATQNIIVATGQRSQHWLVQREAGRHAAQASPKAAREDDDPRLWREAFRRRRNRRAMQVALDVHDLDTAAAIADAAVAAGIEFIEVGDPLIKKVGLHAIEYIKRHVPDATVVAEMMSTDWGRDQVVLAAEAGADVVLLIGPASSASVSAAVAAARPLGIPLVLDAPHHRLSQQWITEMERAGVDGFVITTNIDIDIGIGGTTSLTSARTPRAWTQLPVAVSGGFSPTGHAAIASGDWDILIVGRSISDAVNPAVAARRLVDLVRDNEGHQ